MQTIVYRFSLDVLKSGVQRLIEGLQTQDELARKLEISLVSGSKTYEIPTNNIRADLYLTFPNKSTAIKECEIVGNKIVYEISDADIALKGTVVCQLKLIGIRAGVPEAVLVSPMFEMDVWESATSEVVPDDRFSSLTNAIAEAKSLGDSAIVSVIMDEDNKIIITQRDGTAYESTAFTEFYGAVDQLAETAKNYSEEAKKSAEAAAATVSEEVIEILEGIDERIESAGLSATIAIENANAASNFSEAASASADSASESASNASESASSASISANAAVLAAELTKQTIRVVTQAEYDDLRSNGELVEGVAYLIKDAAVGRIVIDDDNPGTTTVYSSEKVHNLTKSVAKYKEARGTIQDSTTINADTLNGYNASDFVRAGEIVDVNAVSLNGYTDEAFYKKTDSVNASTLGNHSALYFATASALGALTERVDNLPTVGGRVNYREKE